MKRKQIYLPKEMDRRLAQLAEAMGVSHAELIRRALSSFFQKHNQELDSSQKREEYREYDEYDPVLQIIGLAEGDGKHNSLTLEDDLYGGRPI